MNSYKLSLFYLKPFRPCTQDDAGAFRLWRHNGQPALVTPLLGVEGGGPFDTGHHL